MMIELHAFSPWNGYPTWADAVEGAHPETNGAVYLLGEYDFDRSSYGQIADAMQVSERTMGMIVHDEKPVFALRINGKWHPLEGDTTLDTMFAGLF